MLWIEEACKLLQIAFANQRRETCRVFIFETRAHKRLPAVLYEASALTPWPIVLLGTKTALNFAKPLPSRAQFVQCNPPKIFTSGDYSMLMTTPELYESLNADYMLTLQTDAMLCSHPTRQIESFLGWDFVGAPWSRKWHRRETRQAAGGRDAHGGGNGGISLRRCMTIAKAIRNTKSKYRPAEWWKWWTTQPEDVWLQTQTKIKAAPFEVASLFSSEQLIVGRSCAVHRVWEHTSPETLAMMERTFCPGIAALLRDNNVTIPKQLSLAETIRLTGAEES